MPSCRHFGIDDENEEVLIFLKEYLQNQSLSSCLRTELALLEAAEIMMPIASRSLYISIPSDARLSTSRQTGAKRDILISCMELGLLIEIISIYFSIQ
jgi:hypothetical protein